MRVQIEIMRCKKKCPLGSCCLDCYH